MFFFSCVEKIVEIKLVLVLNTNISFRFGIQRREIFYTALNYDLIMVKIRRLNKIYFYVPKNIEILKEIQYSYIFDI